MIAISEALRAATAAYSRGDLGAARREGEAALRAQPNNASVLQLLGVICCQMGDLERGAEYLRQAIRKGSDTPDNRFNLARALVELGKLDEAAALCSDSASGSRGLQRLHADILKRQGQQAEAIAAYERLVEAEPNDFESWNNLGNARHDAADFDGALFALQQARALNPKSATIHTNLGRVLASMDRYQDSCLVLEQAVKLSPGESGPLLELGQALRRLGHSKDALRALGSAARINPQDPEIFVAIGLSFTDLSDLTKAEQAYRFALQAGRQFAPAYVNLGMLLEQANRLGELEALIRQADAAGVAGGDMDYLRALSLRRQGRLQDALDLARANEAEAIDPAIRAHFIGQLADRLDQPDIAFSAFEEMNRAAAGSPAAMAIDRTAYQRNIDRVASLTTREWYSGWAEATVISDPPSPVFLLGFPRSGTTLLDTILMGHADTHVLEEVPILAAVADELGDFTRLAEIDAAEVARLRARYFDELDKVSPPPPGKLVIDKNPLSMLRAPLIHRLFPDAKIILALRHPCDVVLSCFMQNFKVTEATAGFLDIYNASLTYDRIFSYWEQCRDIFPLHVHPVRYEAMVADLEGEMKPLLDFLGLKWDEAILDHQRTATARGYIRTPSYAQVTESLYDRASGRWNRYRQHLEPVLPILKPWTERLGYTLD